MINNRQNGRRRGRGGQQPRNGQPGSPDRGSRLDNRARGNAAQLLEKYKTLARDAQMQGDRVNTEYYHQFADHYFRVLSESRARFEEQRPARSNDSRDDFGGDEDAGDGQRNYQSRDDQNGDDGWDDGDQAPQSYRETVREPTRENAREPAREPGTRQERGDRSERQAFQGDVEGGREVRDGTPRETRPREPGRERGRRSVSAGSGTNAGNGNGNGFVADFLHEPLTPRIEMDRAPDVAGSQQADADLTQGDDAAPKRRRPRRPRTEPAPAEG